MDEQPDKVDVERRTWADGDLQITPPDEVQKAFTAAGITASGAVVAREGLPNRLQRPDRAVARLLGDDGLGRAFDALVASGTVDHLGLLATAVERSHEYRGVPAVLASGEARRWVGTLSDDEALSIEYHEAGERFEEQQAAAVVASARQGLRKRVIRGRVANG